MDAALSSTIAGYLSILIWIVVFIPQLHENYCRKSGEGLSLVFLLIWLVGDILSMIGVVIEKLMLTMFLLTLWYTVADVCLIWQVIYYGKVTHYQKLKQDEDEQIMTGTVFWINLIGSIIVITLITISCCLYYFKSFSIDPSVWYSGLSQWMGWTSAMFYIGSRLPQIIKNWKQQSTEGLSSGMFICTLLGNLLSTLSIFLNSTEKSYILKNLPWIIGSLGTVVFDIMIFLQFCVFKRRNMKHRAD
ncbi:unnamed protein product [Rhizopus stolonifer]